MLCKIWRCCMTSTDRAFVKQARFASAFAVTFYKYDIEHNRGSCQTSLGENRLGIPRRVSARGGVAIHTAIRLPDDEERVGLGSSCSKDRLGAICPDARL